MEPRISIVTLGVRDLGRSYEFYHRGLGFPTTRKPENGPAVACHGVVHFVWVHANRNPLEPTSMTQRAFASRKLFRVLREAPNPTMDPPQMTRLIVNPL